MEKGGDIALPILEEEFLKEEADQAVHLDADCSDFLPFAYPWLFLTSCIRKMPVVILTVIIALLKSLQPVMNKSSDAFIWGQLLLTEM